MNRKQRYQLNKEAKVGDTCVCPSCRTEFVKGSYQQVFCKSKRGTKCKDKYWNNVIETKRNNTTRISPANARNQAVFCGIGRNPYENREQRAKRLGFYDVEEMENYFDEYNGSWDAHHASVEPCEFCGRLVNCECGIGLYDLD